MMLKLLWLLMFIGAVLARTSPNARYAEEFMKSPEGARFSDNVAEDAVLDVPSLISKYGYPVEVHKVVTSDGYILECHRIPHGKDGTPAYRRPVLVMHGLLSSSADWVIMGPGNALGYLLADAGYDVWLLNTRGNYYSRHHITISPDTRDFWRYSWDQIGNFDLPAYIDYVTANTGYDKVHYIGHSQGGTSFLVVNSLRSQYNAKILSFHGLAPAAYFNYNQNTMFRTLAPLESVIEAAVFAMNRAEIFGNRAFMSWFSENYCYPGSIFEPLCDRAITSLIQREYYNSTMLPAILGHTPAGASIRQVAHYGQCIRFNLFRRYNYNNPLTNLREYGSLTPPEYDLSLVIAPTYIYFGLSDREVDYRDLIKLSNNLPNVKKVYQIPRESFNHFDFLWAVDAKEQIYDEILEDMEFAEKNFA